MEENTRKSQFKNPKLMHLFRFNSLPGQVKANVYFFLIIISAFTIIVAPTLFSNGMFMDGLVYAAMSKNMANGLGTFWAPHMSDGRFQVFFGHPPLALGMESLLFRVFGNSILVERFYSLGTFFLVGIFTVLIWKHITKTYRLSWLPVLIWILVPEVYWACSNNMLENTMSVFIMIAALLFLKGMNRKYLFILLSGFSLSMAFLTKGPACLYLWGMPFFAWLFLRLDSLLQSAINTVILVFSTILPILLLYFFNQGAAQILKAYYDEQIMTSMLTEETVHSRFAIIIMFFKAILIPLLLSAVLYFLSQRRNKSETMEHLAKSRNYVLFFIVVALSGVLPIMFTMKQRGFYILTVYPFIALALALMVRYPVEKLVSGLQKKHLKILKGLAAGLLLAAIVVSVSQKGRIGRDKELISDSQTLIHTLGDHVYLNVDSAMYTNWSLHAYLARFGNASIITRKYRIEDYYLVYRGAPVEEGYQKMNIKLKLFDLYKTGDYKYVPKN